ncbi:MAG: PBP1A family penicillin-binding protein [Candidatus Levybacteria bacterium]|nr:PBP1A family penicillin-binding protein [Candidatus Levybacteria bacterium]
MKLALQILFATLFFLTYVGDITIFILKIPFSVIQKAVYVMGVIKKVLWLIIYSFWKKLPFRKIKKTRKAKKNKIFPLPIGVKIKYFLLGTFFSLVFVFIPLTIIIFLQELPSPKQLSFQESSLTTKIFDRNGTLLYQIYANQNRTLIPLSSIPKHLIQATIAIEDKNFYQNSGVDVGAIVRAFIADISGKPLQGGSTITQQLIKSTLLTPERSIERKIKEIILAFWAKHLYTKDQILEMYFNQIPYGGTAWGIEAASEVYFNSKTNDLNLAQSAFLAGLTKAPTIYSPYGETPNLWKERQKEVLTKMEELNYISSKEKEEALKEELVFSNPQSPIYAPHFVMYIKEMLIKKYGIGMVEKGGLYITTSLDLKIQQMAQQIVASEVEKNIYLNLTNGASVVTNPKNGDILAMVGSRDYSDLNSGNFNVTTALRQPGSSIKVVTYSLALSNGFTPATIIDDSPTTYAYLNAPSYSPVNYDGKFHGKMSLRLALANSINIPAIKILAKIGIPNMVILAKQMGITTWGDPASYGLAITLGAADVKMIDMATVYGVLANSGYKVDLNPILKITDSFGNVLEEKKDPILSDTKIPVIDPGVAFIVSNILADNNARSLEFGSNSPLNIPNHYVSVKTGTSDNKRDNWTIGYTPDFVVVTWVGNNDNSPMSQNLASGITGAAPIWHEIMVNLLQSTASKSASKINIPSNIIQKDCIGRKEYFIKGTENLVNCAFIPTPTPK